jgi:hypothetical protein
MSEAPRIIYRPLLGISAEQARDTRAHAWAYVFSCLHAKQKDMPLQTAGEPSNHSTAKGVSHVEHASDDLSSIDHQPFTKEKE